MTAEYDRKNVSFHIVENKKIKDRISDGEVMHIDPLARFSAVADASWIPRQDLI